MENYIIRSTGPSDKAWIKQFIIEHWHADSVVVHETIYYPHKLAGFIAIMDNVPAGLLTFHLTRDECEIVTLDSMYPGLGMGTGLINAVKKYAQGNGCHRLWLITTNDNMDALMFYQKRGFRLAKLYPGAVERARNIKPSIPLYGIESIPIRDEIELEMWL